MHVLTKWGPLCCSLLESGGHCFVDLLVRLCPCAPYVLLILMLCCARDWTVWMVKRGVGRSMGLLQASVVMQAWCKHVPSRFGWHATVRQECGKVACSCRGVQRAFHRCVQAMLITARHQVLVVISRYAQAGMLMLVGMGSESLCVCLIRLGRCGEVRHSMFNIGNHVCTCL